MSNVLTAPHMALSPDGHTSRIELHRVIAPFARADSFKGYRSFVIDVAMYALGIAAVLLAGGLAGKLAGTVLAGAGLVNLGSLSHEAAHRAVVKSRWGNKLIAVVSLTMILFNYRLWIYDHHVLHHGRTNVKHNNFLSPLTLAEYRGRSRLRRAIYRAYHSETAAGILLYYLLERWPTVHFYPGSWLPPRFRASAWGYTALLTAWATALLGTLVTVSSARQESVALAILLGFVVPYAIWFATFSMTAFLQHTNPRLRWYRDVRSVASAPEALSVHVLVPRWLNYMTHYVLEHPVHHISAAVPHYYLKQAQAVLAGAVQPPIITMAWNWTNMRDALRRCKLYDYDRHVWVNFDGVVTAIPDDTLRQRRDGQLPPYAADTSGGVFFPEGKVADPVPDEPVRSDARV